jgi:hypothetical protein
LAIDWWQSVDWETGDLYLKTGGALSSNFPEYTAAMTSRLKIEELWGPNGTRRIPGL